MSLVLTILSWIIWSVALGLSLSFLLYKSPEPAVHHYMKRYGLLAGLGVLATIITDLSKFHLLWWLPATYLFNILLFHLWLRRCAKEVEKKWQKLEQETK